MAEEPQASDQSTEKQAEPKAGATTMRKVLVFGLPALLVQLVVVYFLTAKFIVPLTVHPSEVKTEASLKKAEQQAPAAEEEESSEPEGADDHIYAIKDMIVNPAGTNGQRYLLTTIAFNVTSDEALKDLEKRELAVRDALNSVLTSKTMEELINVAQRELLRKEIAERVKGLVTHGKLSSVYFSKYIVQ